MALTAPIIFDPSMGICPHSGDQVFFMRYKYGKLFFFSNFGESFVSVVQREMVFIEFDSEALQYLRSRKMNVLHWFQERASGLRDQVTNSVKLLRNCSQIFGRNTVEPDDTSVAKTSRRFTPPPAIESQCAFILFSMILAIFRNPAENSFISDGDSFICGVVQILQLAISVEAPS